MANGPVKYRIEWLWTGAGLVTTAVLVDLFVWIPIVGQVLQVVTTAGFGIFFYLKGFGIINPKRALAMGLETIGGEFEIPSSNTIAILYIILSSRSEDKGGKSVLNTLNKISNPKALLGNKAKAVVK